MKNSLTTLLAVTAACYGLALSAHAADAAASAPITKQEAKDLKTQADAEYKARKKVADANEELNKGDCEVAADGSTERACKKDARAAAKHEKAEAKLKHEAQKDAIKSESK
jgi:hypothetical protein